MTDACLSGRYVHPSGDFIRDQRYITTRITADGRDGFPVDPGRYPLVVSRARARSGPAPAKSPGMPRPSPGNGQRT